MRIGIVGGTGKEGKGLAVRWARAGHQVTIGSRDAERGKATAAELSTKTGTAIAGGNNREAIAEAEVILLSVPYSAHASTLADLKAELAGKPVIDITVPLRPPKVRVVHLPEGTSAALEAQALLTDQDTHVIATLHHVSSVHLSDADHEIDCEVLVCCNDKETRALGVTLVNDLGLRGLDAGPLANAVALESLTPVLLHLNKRYKGVGVGIKFTGLPD